MVRSRKINVAFCLGRCVCVCVWGGGGIILARECGGGGGGGGGVLFQRYDILLSPLFSTKSMWLTRIFLIGRSIYERPHFF